ncbi:flagellar basal body rod modification protein [Helicobacter sp. 16-1353]|uniref:flagellar hook assembly protein FlgD n=1 Tax=Helicobacter sp. 16-1353 TaxID=2004996 RepID=UPI000DCC758B|nr:flagellar hook assembly protein FlgD [Helicobacter sp. 16-1353]RAX51554.1 flagellar basal body rod modification protein [Helicobacter sp. 16-1353]
MSEIGIDNKREPIDLNEITGYNKVQKDKVKKDTSKLDNDAFMKLFLEQLKNQDPTAPMETDKIITQTAQLTQVEMQEQTKQTMIEVAEAMKSTQSTNEELKNFQNDMKTTLESLLAVLSKDSPISNVSTEDSPYNSLNMIGKIAETKINGLNVEENKAIDFDIYFDEPIDAMRGIPKLLIFNENKDLVREIDISQYNGQSGYLRFRWDVKDNVANPIPSGAYSVIANYNYNNDGSYNIARLGRGEVQSVIFSDGKPHLRMGELIVPLSEALEFYSKKVN